MVEIIQTPRERTQNDCMIIGDNINEIIDFCIAKIIPSSRAFYERELRNDLNDGCRSMIDVHAGMGRFYTVIYVDPKHLKITKIEQQSQLTIFQP